MRDREQTGLVAASLLAVPEVQAKPVNPRAGSRLQWQGVRSLTAFTLIEILTVITIIGILAALLLPALKAATDKAKAAQARTMVQHTATAFRSYFNEFSVWPTNTNESTVFNLQTNLFRNTAGITFLDVPAKSVSGGAVVVDPWGTPYRCIVDGANYRGFVNNPFAGGGTITAGYAIWSDGPDKTNNTALAQDVGVNKDNIRSW
jgi:prepilin-type N-terminal cleavage/methylation domain-containing protein